MFRVLTKLVGKQAVDDALRDHVNSRDSDGKMKRLIGLSKQRALTQKVTPNITVFTFPDEIRLTYYQQESVVFISKERDEYSSLGAFNTLQDVGGWTSSRNPTGTRHQAAQDAIRRKLIKPSDSCFWYAPKTTSFN